MTNNSSKRSIRHHIVPQFYLRAFANSKEQVAIFDRKQQKRYKQNVNSTAVESDFHTFFTKDGEPSDELERLIAELEGIYASSWSALTSNSPSLNLEQRGIVSSFISLQFLRTAKQRDIVEGISDFLVRSIVKLHNTDGSKKDIESVLAEYFPAESSRITSQIRSISEGKDEPLQLPAERWISMAMSTSEEIVPYIYHRKWLLLESTERCFITSDAPVCLWTSNESQSFSKGGFANADCIIVPVSPKRCLCLLNVSDDLDFAIQAVSDPLAGQIRQIVALNSLRQTIAHPKSEILLDKLSIPVEPPLYFINQVPVKHRDRGLDAMTLESDR